MKLEFYNCPKSEELNSSILPETPEFVSYKPNFELMEKIADEYKNYKNILIIAHGGSITSFMGMYFALKYLANKKAYFLSTVDPDYIQELKDTLRSEDTVVVSISKSGQNMTQIEMTGHFLDYPLVFITGKNSPLKEIADRLKAKVVDHPPIGGRYTAFTEVGLLPAVLVGLDARALFAGGRTFLDLYKRENLAWKMASVMHLLEQKGFVDVFMPFYTHYLFPMANLIVQLCHESFGKEGKGQTYFAHEAPESQHHTNQRFFGGRKNICGIFTTADSFNNQLTTNYPPSLHSVQIKRHALFDVSKIPLEKSLESEAIGTKEDARINGIPLAQVSISSFTPGEIGKLIAFWQLYAVYASVLRCVDPFDQPQVENSKNLSFDKRLQFKGLL
ncbi:MAG: hypothetical protein COT92_02805 [Candidatus Doudnabacteria bacterium CG10_big_fil_rev_8_21_14_0_10_42_18]|uniref:Glucose-6-phosphate isomerase n=1 Tax=Candidatus Doudnabacteria bacterium CG10_big_fil_rev_8_21_14_0_10_42_18 TaxID=1974552 RepID=A0A2H0VCT1_9BACT|nr:MAG: hypothetical protein COT92_02805 [Candidatus Doudnabacteria bacterium CG10_big_fil_rev_8_21_14_0_10_42_18]